MLKDILDVQEQETMLHSISIMTSLGCNLQCDYCIINRGRKHNPARANELQKATIQALQDGSFRENVKNAIMRFGTPPSQIYRMELWGQEPTLTLQHFTADLENWLKDFPSLDTIFFSTNGVAFPEKLIDLIMTMEKVANRPINLQIQFSYDGDYSSANIRGDKDVKVLQHFKTVADACNNVKFNHVNVEFFLHGVVSFELVRTIGNDEDKIHQYWDAFDELAIEINELNRNRKIHIFPKVSVTEEMPYKCSAEDGVMMYNFFYKSLMHNIKNAPLDLFHLASHFSRVITKGWPNDRHEDLDTIMTNIMQSLQDPFFLIDNSVLTKTLSNGFFCGSGSGELKIMYDGTLVSCQNSIYETDFDGLDCSLTDIETATKKSWIEHNIFLNTRTCSDEDIEYYRYKFMTGRSQTFWHVFNTTLSTIYYLAKSKQISFLYLENPLKMVKHAFILSFINQCYYNNGILTGSMWAKDTGIIRRYCNGIADILEEYEDCNRRKNQPRGIMS